MRKRQNLINIIFFDLIYYGKFALILLILIEISAVSIVITAYQVRQLIIEREQMILEKYALNMEWRNLLLEENVLANHNRIECIAIEKLDMQYINPHEESILFMP